jgi:hypothetical protein
MLGFPATVTVPDLVGMMKLPVAPSYANLEPTVRFK